MTISHRVELQSATDGYSVRGYRCPNDSVTSASYLPRCPRCSETTVEAEFEGTGIVWSSTVQRIPNGEFAAERTLAFVDLDGGPRVLCETPEGPAIGSRVRITSVGAQGQAMAVAL